MLERLLPDGAEQSGVYASAYRLLDAANMIAFLFAGLLLPMFAKMIKQKEAVDELVKLAFSLLVVPALVVAIGSYFYQYHLMDMLYKEHIKESAEVFGVLMFCFVAISTTYIFGTLLTANGNLKELNLLATVCMIINVSLNIYLISEYKATGAALVSLITQLVFALVQVLFVQSIFKFRINYRFLACLLCFIGGVVIINYISLHVGFNPAKWVYSFSAMVVVSFIYAFAIRILSVKAIYKILKADNLKAS